MVDLSSIAAGVHRLFLSLSTSLFDFSKSDKISVLPTAWP
jgi:hypothetical protein